MAFKKIQDLDTDVTIALGGVDKKSGKKNPTVIQGYFLGSKTVADRKKKSGISYIYVLQTPKGNVGVWGKTDLDRKMTVVEPGVLVRLTQEGMRTTPNGDMYLYVVEVDEANRIDTSNIAGTQSAAPAVPYAEEEQDTGGGEYGADDNQDDDTDNDAPSDEVPYTPPVSPKTAAKAPTSESQSRVRDLLKNRTKTA